MGANMGPSVYATTTVSELVTACIDGEVTCLPTHAQQSLPSPLLAIP